MSVEKHHGLFLDTINTREIERGKALWVCFVVKRLLLLHESNSPTIFRFVNLRFFYIDIHIFVPKYHTCAHKQIY